MGTGHSRQIAIHRNILHRKIMFPNRADLGIRLRCISRITVIQSKAIIMPHKRLSFHSISKACTSQQTLRRGTYRAIRHIVHEQTPEQTPGHSRCVRTLLL